MAQINADFDRRLRRLGKKHRAMARGYTASMRPDGLIVMQPRRARSRISPRALFIFMMCFFAFKGLLIASIGIAGYEDRVQSLRTGTPVEQVGAWVMQTEPLSMWIAEQIGPVLR